ncbi:MAG: sulfatase-like hydrolase/transferase [Fimbriimonadaceae bacterium]|nr:sulfatase-like hydrolase/transferase [Chitinophagales bacterium]
MKIYFLFLFALFFSVNNLYSQSTLPNIIFITLDDQNDYTEGFDGNPQVETPNIKRLEQLGTTFYNAYCPAPQCGPSRASMITGKDVFYTQVYNNTSYKCKTFRDNFTEEKGNEEIFTIPQYLKDSAGYFTYHLNKVMHCHENAADYDSITTDICEKGLSWNKIFIYDDSSIINTIAEANLGGPKQFLWSVIDDSYEPQMKDFVMTDSAIAFINAYANDASVACNKPLFLGLGYLKPHLPLYIPEKYFSSMYEDIYNLPFDEPYNYPVYSYPYNGLVMPPQPEIPYSDYDGLPENGVARSLADPGLEGSLSNYIEGLNPFPTIDENITDDVRKEILLQTIRANAILAYMAAIKYTDAQIGRFLDALETHPEIYNNTIIILFSDHGFSLGEKKHWRKGGLWETDIRTPFLYIDLRTPEKQISERLVSLTDIFPTICDVIDIPYPIFNDGSNYFDGKSLLPVILNPDTIFERPVISSYIEKETIDQGGCFPQYSIRSERFHYIKYQTNNVYGELDCDITKSITEEELYEIGINREIDPYEWNNLSDSTEFNPVKIYLQQWLPDSNLYLQETYKAIINNNVLDCYLNTSDIIHLSFDLYNPDGTFLNTHPASLTYNWSTNINAAIFTGDNIDIPISAFTEAELENKDRLIIYLNIYDAENKLIAFDIKYFYLHENNKPFANYQASSNGLTACIINYSLTGNYIDTWWDFGEGVIIDEKIPGPYTFQNEGSHIIKNYVEYGNENCIEVYEKTIFVADTLSKTFPLLIFPNPAQQEITIKIADESGNGIVEIFNAQGQRIFSGVSLQCGCTRFEKIDVSKCSRGVYIASFTGNAGNGSNTFVIER